MVACFVAYGATTLYFVRRRRKNHIRKRRTRRGVNGAKKEIVILVSTFHDVLARSVALDLDRRGYIVYVTVSSHEEEQLVRREDKFDIQPLWIDLTSTTPNQGSDVHPNFMPIYNLIKLSRNSSSSAATANSLTLSGLILLPSTTYPSGALSTLPPSHIIDTVNTHFLSLVLTLQQYLPLHYAAMRFHPLNTPPRILLAAPSIASSLPTPTSLLETSLSTTLRSFLPVLRQELSLSRDAPITSVIDLRLGNFDLSTALPKTARTKAASSLRSMPPSSLSPSQEYQGAQLALPWHSSHFRSHPLSTNDTYFSTSLIRASPLRDLHNAIFDSLAPPRDWRLFGRKDWTMPGWKDEVVYVGRGAWVYWVLGKVWIPRNGVGMGMGVWGSRARTRSVGGGGSETGRLPRKDDEGEDIVNARGVGLGLEGSFGDGSAVWEKVGTGTDHL